MYSGPVCCGCRHEKIDFWDDVYGFNMQCIKGLAMQEPLVDVVDQEQVATKPCLLATFNLSKMTKEDAAFTVRATRLPTHFSPPGSWFPDWPFTCSSTIIDAVLERSMFPSDILFYELRLY